MRYGSAAAGRRRRPGPATDVSTSETDVLDSRTVWQTESIMRHSLVIIGWRAGS